MLGVRGILIYSPRNGLRLGAGCLYDHRVGAEYLVIGLGDVCLGLRWRHGPIHAIVW